jgi:hypothetical protein
MTTTSQIVAKAREFIGTPFQHQGRVKGRAMDCAGLPLCVGAELGLRDRQGELFSAMGFTNYARQIAGEMVYAECKRRLIERPRGSMPRPGDVVLLVAPDDPVHMAIATDLHYGPSLDGKAGAALGLVQALEIKLAGDRSSGRVIEHRLSEKWRKQIFAVFSYPGVDS